MKPWSQSLNHQDWSQTQLKSRTWESDMCDYWKSILYSLARRRMALRPFIPIFLPNRTADVSSNDLSASQSSKRDMNMPNTEPPTQPFTKLKRMLYRDILLTVSSIWMQAHCSDCKYRCCSAWDCLQCWVMAGYPKRSLSERSWIYWNRVSGTR
jgi:hypothetical protein